MSTRRKFIAGSTGLIAGTLAGASARGVKSTGRLCAQEVATLCGEWRFRTDPRNVGVQEHWYSSSVPEADWQPITVPHTWQVEVPLFDYRGVAWYRRSFNVPSSWQEGAVRVEFEAVFHTATVWVNGQFVGEHARKGYTAFTLDVTHVLQAGRSNAIAVRVDSAFDRHMLPRGRASDWANDGGIFRPVQLLVTPKTFVERVDIDATPDFASGDGHLAIRAYIRNTSGTDWKGDVSFRAVEENTSVTALPDSGPMNAFVRAGAVEEVALRATLPNAKLWHFDHPRLYRLELSISDERDTHCLSATFGFRKLEIRDGAFHLNGEHVRLMGVERMAGSNPEFGMAEPLEWITRDHADMKHLNCIFTRVHWPQDKRVLDYCDRHGILMQCEVPAWGAETFDGMSVQPDADIMENGLEQLREMVARDRNHPSIVVWGLCNEIWGQNPPAYQFAKHMLEEAKRLDPARLCSYASNSLSETPQRDVAGLMDFVEANEYYGTWAPGTAADASRYLDEIHAAFPGKPVVVSEYGYCACTADRPEGDEKRIGILRSHDAEIRSKDFVGGAIFFCYNDYRTHAGDRGAGCLQQRVHGVVDIYGTQKASYEVLRRESSPVELMTVEKQRDQFQVVIKTRSSLPMYALQGYKLRGIFFGKGDIPVERQEIDLPEASPGSETKLELRFSQSEAPLHIQFDLLRPTSFSVYSFDWKP
jgi:beta-galactosidase